MNKEAGRRKRGRTGLSQCRNIDGDQIGDYVRRTGLGRCALPAGAARAFATHQGITAALGSGQAKHQLAAQLMQAEGGNLSRLTADAAHVKEAWQDMVSLGMYDAQLWDTIDLCWEVVLAALNLAAAQQ